MKISFNWLREFVDVPDDPQQLGARLTSVGLTLDAIDVVGDDTILELDVTANRGDCLSHLGVAREVAAIYRVPIRIPGGGTGIQSTGSESIEVSIADPSRCGRYTARVIRGVAVGASPDWLAQRLESSGIRPINNVADVTNYVLLELGHPMHAFDLNRLEGKAIEVRSAHPGETLTTLDGVARNLDASMLLVTDGRAPVALAGIMGGRRQRSPPKHAMSCWRAPGSIHRLCGVRRARSISAPKRPIASSAELIRNRSHERQNVPRA